MRRMRERDDERRSRDVEKREIDDRVNERVERKRGRKVETNIRHLL